MSLRFCAAAAALAIAQPLESQPLPAPPAPLTYADLADLALAAPIAVHLRIRDADALARGRGAEPPGRTSAFFGPGRRGHADSRRRRPAGRGQLSRRSCEQFARAVPPRLRDRDEVLVLASRVPNRPAELRLVAPDAQLALRARRPPSGCARSCARRPRPTRRRGSPASAAPSTSPAPCPAKARPRSSCRRPATGRSR